MIARTAALFAIPALVAFAALSASPASPVSAQDASVTIGDIYYCDPAQSGQVCITSIPQGGTVTWNWIGSLPHTVTGTGFDSGQLTSGTFSHTFDTAGSFDYHCNVHPTQMMGRVIVLGPDTPGPSTSTPTTQAGAAGATRTPTSSAGQLPSSGSGTGGGSDGNAWAIAGLSAMVLAGVLGGTALLLRSRRVER